MSNPNQDPRPTPGTGPLAGTGPLTREGDLAAQMVAGINRFLLREIRDAVGERDEHWSRDLGSHEGYTASVEPNRRRLRNMIGAVDPRERADMRIVTPATDPESAVARGPRYRVFEVRWSVLQEVEGEGLLIEPDGEPRAMAIALPDCDVTPEMLVGLDPGIPAEAQFARRMAENGCRVLVPSLLDRQDTYSGIPGVRMTNQSHREFIYRAAYEVGRHVIGYEVQKVLAAVDALASDPLPVGVYGYGEGGLVALHAAALDTRIHGAAVSGYFQPREDLWREPMYRNVFGLLREFGDAEIATLVAPRPLVVEASRHPEVPGPPAPGPVRAGAAPGQITTPPAEAVEAELDRARGLVDGLQPPPQMTLVRCGDGTGWPGSDEALSAFLRALGIAGEPAPAGHSPEQTRAGAPPEVRARRQFDQLLEHTQACMREAEFRRQDYWSGADTSSLGAWEENSRPYRSRLWNDVIGPLPPASMPPSPRTRLVYNAPRFKGYEVVLGVYRNVFAYGILLVPKYIRKGDRRPVVVCQHGLEGRAQDVADPASGRTPYHRYGSRLADLGYVVYAPQNPYIGGDAFRTIQRKANPLGASLFSFIVRQHEATLDWLATLPFVDPDRIAFYGLSYGGKTALRVPALVERYCLSICSGDYNEWIWKNVSARHGYSYLTTGEYEMPEFNLGNTFNHAEMSWLICPRPFMVERGHHDGVAPDEWVAYEYARTRRHYVALGVGDRTEIEFFDGPHEIHGEGTFAFLRKHLRWRNSAR